MHDIQTWFLEEKKCLKKKIVYIIMLCIIYIGDSGAFMFGISYKIKKNNKKLKMMCGSWISSILFVCKNFCMIKYMELVFN